MVNANLWTDVMSDIFISYASADRPRGQMLAEALARQGWTVFWDRTIPPGKTFDEVIEMELAAAKCVIGVWSRTSVKSAWVRAEAADGLNRGILIPVLIEDTEIPLVFRQIQAAGMVDWDGNLSHPGFMQLVKAVSGILGPPPAAKAEKQEISAREGAPLEKADYGTILTGGRSDQVLKDAPSHGAEPVVLEDRESPHDTPTIVRKDAPSSRDTGRKKWAVVTTLVALVGVVIAGLYVARVFVGDGGEERVTSRPQEAELRKTEKVAGRQDGVAILLAQAANDLKALRLTNPKGQNALERYRKILSLEPGNAVAKQGIARVVAHYIELAKKAIADDQLGQADRNIKIAEAIEPGAVAVHLARVKLAERKLAKGQAELKRQVELRHRAEARAEAESKRQGELKRQAEAKARTARKQQEERIRQLEAKAKAKSKRQKEAAARPSYTPPLDTGAAASAGKYKLAIFPSNLNINAGEHLPLIFTGFEKAMKAHATAFKLEYSFHRDFPSGARSKSIDDHILPKNLLEKVWTKSSFFATKKPNVKLVTDIAKKLNVGVVLLGRINLDEGVGGRRGENLDYIDFYVIDVARGKTHIDNTTTLTFRWDGDDAISSSIKRAFEKFLKDR